MTLEQLEDLLQIDVTDEKTFRRIKSAILDLDTKTSGAYESIEVGLTAQDLWDIASNDGFEILPAEVSTYFEVINGSIEYTYNTTAFQGGVGETPYFVLTNESAALRLYGAAPAGICVDAQDGVSFMLPSGNSNTLYFDGTESMAGGYLEQNAIGEALMLRLWDADGDAQTAFVNAVGDGNIKLKLTYKKHIFG